MKRKFAIISIIFLLLMVPVVNAATDSSTTGSTTSTSSTDAAALVYMSSVSMDPEVFYPKIHDQKVRREMTRSMGLMM